MAIIFQHDKRSNITYAYENQSYWDKEKRMSRAKRTLIGRVDPETGEIIPTDGRGRTKKTKDTAEADLDYKNLYEKMLKKCAAQESLIAALQKEIGKLNKEE
jgi:hypothetical protein